MHKKNNTLQSHVIYPEQARLVQYLAKFQLKSKQKSLYRQADSKIYVVRQRYQNIFEK